jgi:hypothetical protein
MAFLYRVVNGGGTLEREYAMGRDRMDLCLRYGQVTLGIEPTVWYTHRPDPQDLRLEQLESYLNRIGPDSRWLIIFDRRHNAPPTAERIQAQMTAMSTGPMITVICA